MTKNSNTKTLPLGMIVGDYQKLSDGKIQVMLTHPSLVGALYAFAPSEQGVTAILDSIDLSKKEPTDPISVIWKSAGQLISKVGELKN